MDLTHIHLYLNHLPIWGSIITLFFIMYSFYKKNLEFTKFFLWFYVFLAVITIPVFLTGDVIDEVIKLLPGINESMVEDHETAGWVSFILIETAGVFALVGLYLIKKKGAAMPWFKYSFAVLIVLCIVSFIWTAYLGGAIRHSESVTNTQIENVSE